jgi:four helix bundle protein
MANIAEGFERGGDKEFIQFLSHSKGLCGEVKSHLYVALDQQYVTGDQFKLLYDQADEVSRLTAGFMAYLQSSAVRGHKFKRPT